ncbi:MAG: hypothetical protein U0Q16_37980 [Bryobacteraceae bacterium]
MAEHHYPGQHPDRPLRDFINHPALENSARQAETLLTRLPQVFVPRVQYKSKGVKNTCWYVAFPARPDVWLVNLTITPANVEIEFRLSRYFEVTADHKQLGMRLQNRWPTFGLERIGGDTACELLNPYFERVASPVFSGEHRPASRSTAEFLLKDDLRAAFPGHAVNHGHRRIPNPDTGKWLELDLEVPTLSLAIEVQGPAHYSDIYRTKHDVRKRDEYKKEWCQKESIRLIHLDWEAYMKSLYPMTAIERRKSTGMLVSRFLESGAEFLLAGDEVLANITARSR